MSELEKSQPETEVVLNCYVCNRRPERDRETKRLRRWSYAGGRVCTLSCCEWLATFLSGGWSLEVSRDKARRCRDRERKGSR